MITQYLNFFTRDHLEYIYREIIPTENFTTSNYDSWDPSIVDESALVESLLLTDDNYLREYVEENLNVNLTGLSFLKWSKGSYIPWHDDHDHKWTGTVFLTRRWEERYGGWSIIQNPDNSLRIFLPEFNTAYTIDNTIPHSHCTTPTHCDYPVRYTLQMFGKKKP